MRRNIATIMSGNLAAGLIGLAALALKARALGPELVGVLALLQAFTSVVGRISSFDTWQPVVKFGAEAQERGDLAGVRDVAALALVIDVIAAVAAALVALVLVYFAGPLVGVSPQHRDYAAMFCVAIAFGFAGGAGGVLRLTDRFWQLSSLQVGLAVANLILAAVLWALKAPFLPYVVGTVAIIVGAALVQLLLSWRALSELGAPSIFGARIIGHPLWRRLSGFSLWTSGMSSASVLRQNAELFVLGWLAPAAATGIFAVASRLAAPANQFAQAMRLSVFPEFSRAQSRSDLRAMLSAFLRFSVALAVLGVVAVAGFLLVSRPLLTMIFGEAYAGAGVPVALILVGYLIYCAGAAWISYIVAQDGPFWTFIANLVALIAQFICALVLIPRYGVNGAAAGACIGFVIWGVIIAYSVTMIARRQNTPAGGE